MILKLCYALCFTPFLVAPFLYRCHRSPMTGFCRRMLASRSMRRLYTLLLFLLLLVFHFCYLSLFKNHYDVIPSTALSYVLLSHRLCERLFYAFQPKRMMGAVMLFVLVLLFVPHFFTLGFSLGVTLVGSAFYPTRLARDRWQFSNDRWSLSDKALAELYHQD